MKSLYEWDEDKAKENLRKHKVDFKEAETVFDDPLSITVSDPDHSEEEERFIDIGISKKRRVLAVVYTERRKKIRIISAREATRAERKKYYEEENTP